MALVVVSLKLISLLYQIRGLELESHTHRGFWGL